jgi:hypothetical protein
MTALARNKNTKEIAVLGSAPAVCVQGIKASAEIFAGSIVCLDTAQRLVPGAATASLIAFGVALEYAKDTSGVDLSTKCRAKPGVFGPFTSATGGGDDIAADDIGKVCYVVDDQTVALTSDTSTRPVAGKVHSVDANGGVYVAIGLTRLV